MTVLSNRPKTQADQAFAAAWRILQVVAEAEGIYYGRPADNLAIVEHAYRNGLATMTELQDVRDWYSSS